MERFGRRPYSPCFAMDVNMAFSQNGSIVAPTWGVAPGCDGSRPSAKDGLPPHAVIPHAVEADTCWRANEWRQANDGQGNRASQHSFARNSLALIRHG